jgi:hypothetical protein
MRSGPYGPYRDDRPYWVVDEAGCWIWQRGKAEGYGVVWRDGRVQRAHRVVYEQHRGPIPDGLHLDHLCRVKACVNPDHLEPVTNAENCRRGVKAKLNHEAAAEIRARVAAGEAQRDVAADYGVTPQCIRHVVIGRTWVAS